MVPTKEIPERYRACMVPASPRSEMQSRDLEAESVTFDDDDDFVFIFSQHDADTPQLTEFAKKKLQESGFDLSRFSTVDDILGLKPEQYQPFAKLIREFELSQEKIVGCCFYFKFSTMPYGMYKNGLYTIETYPYENATWLTRLDGLYQGHKKIMESMKALQRVIHSDNKTDEEKICMLKEMVPDTEKSDPYEFVAEILAVKEKTQDEKIDSLSTIQP